MKPPLGLSLEGVILLPYHNLEIRHQNPGATMPLILPVHVVCNTSDDELHNNIRANSAVPREWIAPVKAHDGIAVLCGSGPSIDQHLGKIAVLQAAGAKVFAMNGCAAFLSRNGITPDYQVMIDARPETATLVGPATDHLIASQCHPDCFARAPAAKLWHLQIDGIEDDLPDAQPEHALIGGAASVGNTATCLAYTMGYRDMRCYGYDSSHRDGKGHAFAQPLNDGDPCAWVDHLGKTYLTSLTMKLQAEKFQRTAADLISIGCKISVIGEGLLPAIFNAPRTAATERSKYESMWQHESYRRYSPGENAALEFVTLCGIDAETYVIDFGCGTGRGGAKIRELTGAAVTLIDFAENALDPGLASTMQFIRADLTQPIGTIANVGYCVDVMEHIPPESVDAVIACIMDCVKSAYFKIATIPDEMGELIGDQLHLSVLSFDKWRNKFSGYKIKWSKQTSTTASFLIMSKG